jgi:excisionase family DNA binding protein
MEMLLTIEQAATRLQLHPETVRRQIKRGLMRAVKRGRVWRVPESALEEVAPVAAAAPTEAQAAATMPQASAEMIWREMISGDAQRHNDALRTLFAAPDEVRAIITRRSAEAATAYYSTPEGEAELADWRAVSDPVHDEAGDYYTDEEEAEFRARRAQGATV